MDQGCAFGKRAVLMSFDGDGMDARPVQVGQDIPLVLVDLGGEKDTQHILRRLNRCYPSGGGAVAEGVRSLLGRINRGIVQGAVDALAAGDAQRLGALMDEAQSAFDRYAIPACPEELTAPRLHQVLAYAPLRQHVWGGKGVGSQGEGAAQFVARSLGHQQAAMRLLERDMGLQSLALTVPADPAGERNPLEEARIHIGEALA
jgi:galactokinase